MRGKRGSAKINPDRRAVTPQRPPCCEGGIRGVEIGSVMFACLDPEDNTWHYPALELLRLTIPRRVYTQSHFDYDVDTLDCIKSRAGELRGYTFTCAPELLRHFTARFEPL